MLYHFIIMYYYDIRILEDNDPHQILILCTHITVALELEHMEHDCWMQTDVVDILPSYIHPYTHTYIHTYIHAYDVCVCVVANTCHGHFSVVK